MNSDESSPPEKPDPPAIGDGSVAEDSVPREPPNGNEGDGQAADCPPPVPTLEASPPVRRPLRLNPTVTDGEFKAVPSLGGGRAETAQSTVSRQYATPQSASESTAPRPPAESPAVSPSAETASPPDTAAQTGPPAGDADVSQPSPVSTDSPLAAEPGRRSEESAKARSSRSPVELPPRVDRLDAEMEAEIEAALSGSSLQELPAAEEKQDVSDSEGAAPGEESVEVGAHLTGRIQSIHGDDVFLDAGLRSPAVIPFRQFEKGKRPAVGQLIEVVVERVDHAEGLIACNLPKGVRKVSGGWEALQQGHIVDCMVTKTNKGGLEVTVGGLRGFLPASQVDFSFVSDLEPFVGRKLKVKVLEANPKKRNLVVSHRAYLEIERKESEQALWDAIEEGQSLPGTIKTIKEYGAFVDLGGADGFLHIGEISWGRIRHPSEVVQEGQQVEVKVLRIDREKRKISLGMRQLTSDPWLAAIEKFGIGATVTGTVTRATDFGAFVLLEPGVEGLVHISELDHKRVNKVTDVLKVGQSVETKILEVDPERRRIGLSVKALLAQPEAPAKDAEQSAPPPTYQRKRKGRLKGGTGEPSGGGLFGNPKDFA